MSGDQPFPVSIDYLGPNLNLLGQYFPSLEAIFLVVGCAIWSVNWIDGPSFPFVVPHLVRFPRLISKVLNFSYTVPNYCSSMERRTIDGLVSSLLHFFFNCFLVLPLENLSNKTNTKAC